MLLLLLLFLVAAASAAPTRADDAVSLASREQAAAAAAEDGEGLPPAAGPSPSSAADAAADGSSEAKLYKILLDLTDRHRVKRPSVMGLDNYDEATTTLELLRQRHKSRPRSQKPTPNPEVIRRILRILAMGKK